MLRAGWDDINACRVDAGMPEDIRQLHNIFFDAVKDAGKQVAKIVREHFLRQYTGTFAQLFHLPPNVTAIHRLSAFYPVRRLKNQSNEVYS